MQKFLDANTIGLSFYHMSSQRFQYLQVLNIFQLCHPSTPQGTRDSDTSGTTSLLGKGPPVGQKPYAKNLVGRKSNAEASGTCASM